MPAPPPPAAPRRILLIRLSAFGDVVIATALLQGLRHAHPEAEIDWLVQPEFAELLRTQPAIAQVQLWERKRWGQLFRGLRWLALLQAMLGFRRTLQARNYDWVIDAQGLFKSRALARLAGGRYRIGYDSKEPGKHWLHRRVQRHPEAHTQRQFIGDEHAPMLAALTGTAQATPQLDLTAVDEAARPAGRYLVVAPFTTRPQKHWPQAHWIALLRALTQRGESVLLLGGPADGPTAQQLVEAVASARLDNRVGHTCFIQAAALIAGAEAVIGVDTGLTHLGFALGRPTMALFGSTRPYAAAREPHSAVLFKSLPCAPCGRHPTCSGRFDCLQQLTPHTVLETLRTLLARDNKLGKSISQA